MIATEKTIHIAGIANDSIVDGPGLRMAIFFQGCRRHCEGCHNPESWPLDDGHEVAGEALWAFVCKNPLINGVTFSGGEPLLRAEPLLPLAKAIRSRDLDLAIYTGYTFEEILEDGDEHVLQLLALTHTLIDGHFILEQKSMLLPFRGSKNQRILDVPRSLMEGRAVPTEDPAWSYFADE